MELTNEFQAETIPNVSSLLNCTAPLFELPPSDVFQRGGPAATGLFNRSAWLMCTALRAVNAGLRRYKERHCPPGSVLPGREQETFRAAPLATQFSDIFASAGQRRRNSTTVDWAEKPRITQERLAKREATRIVTTSRQ